ncbi:insulinase family protein [Desulfosarcina cetonica]|uniref:insulinase family protein n=1 Tax=Desulfosarcina cetonica TaxID=90730 RepID=UPI0006D29E32|nr:insulinase family protein [Desulfosarcina cetonica]
MAEESPDSQMMRLAQNECYFGDDIPMQTVIDQIDAVTSADILSLANALWSSGSPALTMLGPQADRINPEVLLHV